MNPLQKVIEEKELKNWALGVQQGADNAEREFVANRIVEKMTPLSKTNIK